MDADEVSPQIGGLQIHNYNDSHPGSIPENMCDTSQITKYANEETTRTPASCNEPEYEGIFRGTLVTIKQEYDQCSELGEFHSDRGRTSQVDESDPTLLEPQRYPPDDIRDLSPNLSRSNTACCVSHTTNLVIPIINSSSQPLESVMNLCQRCLPMLCSIDLAEMEESRHAGETYELHQTPDSLSLSSLTSCRICSKIQQQVEIDTRTETLAKTIREPRQQYYGPGPRAFVRVMIWKYDASLGLSCFVYYENVGFKALPEPSRVSFALTPVLSK
jgi:hypothetical protein